MTFTLLAGHALEIVHLRRRDRLPDEGQMVNDRRLAARLIVLHEQLYVLHVLELDEPQLGRVARLQVLRVDLQVLHRHVRVGHVEVERARLVDEQLHVLGPVRWRRLDFQRVQLHHLIERDRDDQLLVTVGRQVAAGRGERIRPRVVVRLV